MDITTRNFLLLKLAETLGVIAVILIAGTSGKMIFRPVDFKYPTREGRVSSGLYAILLVLAFVYYLSGLDFRLPLDDFLQSHGQQLVLALVGLGIIVIALYFRRQPPLSAGWGRKQNRTIGLRVGLMLVFFSIFLRGKISAIIDGVSAQEGLALLLIVLTSLCEETIFRGYLQLRVSSWLGKTPGWLVVSAAFVLWHLPRLLLDLPHIWINLLLISVQSLLLGWIMQKSGHVAAPILFRAVSDWLTLI